MARDRGGLRRNAVVLRGDSMGVATEDTPRKVQKRTDDNGFHCSLNQDWLAQLQLADQGEATLHSMSMGIQPVIVQNPAIIIQPASLLEGVLDE